MSTLTIFLWALVGLLLLTLIYSLYYSKHMVLKNPFTDRNLLGKDMDKPVIWLYYDTSEVNSRWWADFGARSSRALNLPFLNLCYETIVTQNKWNYRVEVISGIHGVAELLGGWDALPPGLRSSISPVNGAEMNWIKAAILAKYGGLWLSPYTICVKPFGELPKDSLMFFGTDINETYSGAAGTTLPGFNCMWSPKPENPFFVEWRDICARRLQQKRGGEQIRGDEKWDWIALSSKHPLLLNATAEGARKKGGRRIELEDLLATGHQGNLPFTLSKEVIYVPIFWPELRDREFFGWFLRMNERQIMESDISVKYLIKKGLIEPPKPVEAK